MNKDSAKPWLGLLGAAALTQCGVAGPSLDGVYTSNAVTSCGACNVSGSSSCQCCCGTTAGGSSAGNPLVTLTITNSAVGSAHGTLTAQVFSCYSVSCNLAFSRSGNSLTPSGDCTLTGCGSVTTQVTGGAITVGDLVANLSLEFNDGTVGSSASYSCTLSVTSLLSRR